jgi:hypothetical protein
MLIPLGAETMEYRVIFLVSMIRVFYWWIQDPVFAWKGEIQKEYWWCIE